MRLACLGGDEAQYKLIIRLRINMITTHFCHPRERRVPDLIQADWLKVWAPTCVGVTEIL